MGFFKSLKSQVGRDTGRVISNAVWGDKHASVYRRAGDKINEKRIEAQMEAQIEAQREAQERMIKQQQLEKIQDVTETNVASIIAMKLPKQKDELIEMLQELFVKLTANPWGSVFKDECKITNKYADAIVTKADQIVFTFKTKFSNEFEILYYEQQLNELKKQRKKKMYTEVVIVSAIVAVFLIFGIIMTIREQAQKAELQSQNVRLEAVQ
jgi:hypothetical protein